MTVQAFTLDGFEQPRRRSVRGRPQRLVHRPIGVKQSGLGLLPKGSVCKESVITPSGVERCVSYTRPKNWQALYKRADHARVGWRPLAKFDKPMTRDEVRRAIRRRKAGGWAYQGYDEDLPVRPARRVPGRGPFSAVPTGGRKKMAKTRSRKRRPANKGKKCKRFGTATRNGKRVRVCKSYGGGRKKTTRKRKSSSKRKGRCLRWSKGRTRCLKRDKS